MTLQVSQKTPEAPKDLLNDFVEILRGSWRTPENLLKIPERLQRDCSETPWYYWETSEIILGQSYKNPKRLLLDSWKTSEVHLWYYWETLERLLKNPNTWKWLVCNFKMTCIIWKWLAHKLYWLLHDYIWFTMSFWANDRQQNSKKTDP